MQSTIFHEPWWLDAVAPGRWGRVQVEKGGRVCGWLPYATYRRFGLTACGRPQITHVFHPVVAIEGRKAESVNRAVIGVVSDLIAQLPASHYMEFVLGPDWPDALAWEVCGFRTRVEHTFVLDAGQPDCDPWREMRDKTRNLVRRAQERLTVREMPADAFRALYAANLDGEPCYFDLDHIEAVHHAVWQRDRGRILAAADADGRVHAAAFFVWDATDCYYFLSTRDPRSPELGAVSLLVWEGIREAQARGLRFDFDGVTSRARMQFMLGFGGRIARRFVVERGSLLHDARRELGAFKNRVVENRGGLLAPIRLTG